MISLLTALYLCCFQLCAWPAVARIVKRGSSKDLSIWREVLLMVGASSQLVVMLQTGVVWQVAISPVATIINVAVLTAVILKYRTP